MVNIHQINWSIIFNIIMIFPPPLALPHPNPSHLPVAQIDLFCLY
jgi:hypothetical protein